MFCCRHVVVVLMVFSTKVSSTSHTYHELMHCVVCSSKNKLIMKHISTPEMYDKLCSKNCWINLHKLFVSFNNQIELQLKKEDDEETFKMHYSSQNFVLEYSKQKNSINLYLRVYTKSIGTFLFVLENDLDLNLNLHDILMTNWEQNKGLQVILFINNQTYFLDPFEIDHQTGIHGKLQTNMKHFRMKVPRNFNKYPLRVEIFNSVYSDEILSANASVIGYRGPDVDIAHIITNQLNFTMQRVDNDGFNFGFVTGNETFNGALGTLQQHRCDIVFTGFFIKDYEMDDISFTAPVYSDKLCCMVLKAGRVPPLLLPFLTFEIELWYSLVCVALMVICFWSLLRWGNNRIMNYRDYPQIYNLPSHIARSNEWRQYAQIFVDSWILMFSSPFRRFTKKPNERILIITVCIVSLIIVSVFSSSLANVYIKPLYFKDIDLLEDLDEKELPIFTRYKGFLVDAFQANYSGLHYRLSAKSLLINSSVGKMVQAKSAAAFTRESQFELYWRQEKTFHLMTECPKTYGISYVLPKDSVFLDIINEQLGFLRASGIVKNLIISIRYNLTLNHNIQNREQFLPNLKILTINDLQMSFYILITGSMVGFIVLLGELGMTMLMQSK
ncbi:unnamed protein product [Diamesa serratosioi]